VTDPQQPGPVTLAEVLRALNATTGELIATKAEVKALKEESRELKGEARFLRTYGRHNRAFVIVDVLLTILLTAFGYLSVHAVQSASHANSAQLALCQAGNVSRAQQIQLWDYVLTLSSKGSPQTPQQKQRAAEFRVYLHHVFASRDCRNLGR
jgi:regulator of extracellular matrix RemA (YlzA/DUF370 family)